MPISTLRILTSLVVAGLAFAATACGGVSGESSAATTTKLSLVVYSTPKEAYEQIIPAFKKTPAGRGVGFTQSYGASGEQARAVISGLRADVVALSLAPDVTKLVDEKLVAANWAQDEFKGFVTNSVVVFAVRKGNPKNVKTWDDLLEPGIEVVTPNPFTSGGAKWNIMAAYGAQLQQGKAEVQGVAYLKSLFDNVVVQDKSARESLQTFAAGKGDVLLAYENEAITAKQKGLELDYVIPNETILIQNPAAVTTKAKPAAKAFLDYLRTPAAQKVYAAKGYRTVLADQADTAKYPVPAKLFKIDDVGGWSKINKTFFDPDNGIFARIQRDLGVSTG